MLHSIDLHKRVLQVASMHSDGEAVVQECRMPACERALGSYLRQWPGCRHRVVVETTGSWYWVADLLREHGAELKLAHAAKVEAITAAKVKTDGIDARTLVTMLRLNQYLGRKLLGQIATDLGQDRRQIVDLLRLPP